MFKTESVRFCSKLLQEEYTLPFQICPQHCSKIYCILLGNVYKYPLSPGARRLVLKALTVCASRSPPAISPLLRDSQDVSEPDPNLPIQNPLPSPRAPRGRHAVTKLTCPFLAQNPSHERGGSQPSRAHRSSRGAALAAGDGAVLRSEPALRVLPPGSSHPPSPLGAGAPTAPMPSPRRPSSLSPPLTAVHIFDTSIRSKNPLLSAMAG